MNSNRARDLILSISVALVSVTGRFALGADGGPGKSCCIPGVQARTCFSSPFYRDDYCPKPLPATACPVPGSLDCYRRKPLPCPPWSQGCGSCDDYLRKSLPAAPCPFRPCPDSADACLKARWYEQPFAVKGSASSALRR